jgi:hypothetical protein
MENAASTFFGELLNDWIQEDELVDPLTTRVAIADQDVGLTETGERLQFEIPSVVDFQYIGEKEIPSITATLQNLTDANLDEAAYSNLEMLAGTSSFTITFSNTTTADASTLLFTIESPSNSGSSGQTGLIVACTFATVSLVLASLVLLWAVGVFDGWNCCKNLRSRFYLPDPKASESPLPYGMTAKSTAEETEDGHHNVGALPMRDDEESAMQDQGIEMTPSRGIFREEDEEDSELYSPADSETDITNLSQDISHVSSVAPLGIASMRKEKSFAKAESRRSVAHSTATMSPESILADIQSIQLDID